MHERKRKSLLPDAFLGVCTGEYLFIYNTSDKNGDIFKTSAIFVEATINVSVREQIPRMSMNAKRVHELATRSFFYSHRRADSFALGK